MALRLPIKITQGKTFQQVLRWETDTYLYVAISSIANTAPVRIVTATPHGLTDGWRAAVVSAGGMRQINAENDPPKDSEFHRVTIIDPTTVDLNTVNAAGYSTYTSGGYLQFFTPASLAGCTARLVVKSRVGGTERVRLTDVDGIVLDDTAKTVTFTFPALDSAAYTWRTSVFELEIEDADGVVTLLAYGPITVKEEVATP